jgi:hypothetical protein
MQVQEGYSEQSRHEPEDPRTARSSDLKIAFRQVMFGPLACVLSGSPREFNIERAIDRSAVVTDKSPVHPPTGHLLISIDEGIEIPSGVTFGVGIEWELAANHMVGRWRDKVSSAESTSDSLSHQIFIESGRVERRHVSRSLSCHFICPDLSERDNKQFIA